MLDFTTREKKTLPVKLPDGRTVLLTAPKKGLYTNLAAFKRKLDEGVDPEQQYDEILRLSAEILSNNRSDTALTAEEVEKLMDLEDMSLLIGEYYKYAKQVIGNPN